MDDDDEDICNYDSDDVNEDLEANLYASIYFDDAEEVKPTTEECPAGIDNLQTSPISTKPDESTSPVSQSTQKPQACIDSDSDQKPECSTPELFLTPCAENNFTWNLPAELEGSVTSLSSVADAIYLNLTGEVPPSIRQSTKKKRIERSSFSPTSKVMPLSFPNDLQIETTPSKMSRTSEPNVSFNFGADNGTSSEAESENDAISLSDESDSEKERALTDIDVSDIILGVSSVARNSFTGPNGDDPAEIAERLRRCSSEPSVWRIDPADKMPHSRNRYYYPSEKRTCSICTKKGHGTHECSRTGPVCILCGIEGHFSGQCPVKCCSACLSRGHNYSSCRQRFRLRDETCPRCEQLGHTKNLCPEIWRQYHDTTVEGSPVATYQARIKKSCSNCGRRGHTVDDCRSRPFQRGSLVRRRIMVYDKHNVYGGRLAKTVRTKKQKIALNAKTQSKSSRSGDETMPVRLRRQRGQEPHNSPHLHSTQQQANLRRAVLEASKRLEHQRRTIALISKKEAARLLKEERRIQKAEQRMEKKLFRQALKQQMYPRKRNFFDSGENHTTLHDGSPPPSEKTKNKQAGSGMADQPVLNTRHSEPNYLGFDNSTSPHSRSSSSRGRMSWSAGRGDSGGGSTQMNGFAAEKRRRSFPAGGGQFKTPSKRRRTNNIDASQPKNDLPNDKRPNRDLQFNPDWNFDNHKKGPFVEPRRNSNRGTSGEPRQSKNRIAEEEDWYKKAIREPDFNSWSPPSSSEKSKSTSNKRRIR